LKLRLDALCDFSKLTRVKPGKVVKWVTGFHAFSGFGLHAIKKCHTESRAGDTARINFEIGVDKDFWQEYYLVATWIVESKQG